MAVKPIVGVRPDPDPHESEGRWGSIAADLKGSNELDASLGFAMGNVFWHGFHMPRTNARDIHYKKLEDERASRLG
ncbi:hypothetical protein INS49_012576 [Diaporthe citri]|uniref:uncharacterized protein n=1 Tax=Diaporthe citri TaxID=83186 RepID=UPI001C8052FA|nr:uncharacterized protein INS49_012576 [Diaporthe citri]KAG6359056.1 hypothetical protein INS49_012576 [Diaporthe citri]